MVNCIHQSLQEKDSFRPPPSRGSPRAPNPKVKKN